MRKQHYTHAPRPVKYDGDDQWECQICGTPIVDEHTPTMRHVDDESPAALPTLPAVDRNVVRTGRQATSQAAAAAHLPRSGTLRALVFDVIARPQGATDDEVEVVLGRSHQSVSASRNTLMRDEFVEAMVDDAGDPVRRSTRSGNAATVWTLTADTRARTSTASAA